MSSNVTSIVPSRPRPSPSASPSAVSRRDLNDRATSAVDGDLKVHGVDNLYVADASVFPSIPNGNVHSTVLAVASAFAKRLAAKSHT